MFISRINLNNFRVYFGSNSLQLSEDTEQNITLIAGNNGFGKTSFLTSLVWGLYGKLMTDVDERYRQEIYESGGYKRYCEKLMNRQAWSAAQEQLKDIENRLVDKSISIIQKAELKKQKVELSSFSVSIQLSGVLIPSVKCELLSVKRTYNLLNHQEDVEILIDGRVNELTKNVGHEIFINDFILPREIAKFFFFDAEKIVSLAEINTAEEKQYLSKAYAEVLGIKKYTDLKANLINLRLRLRKNSALKFDKEHLEKLIRQLEQTKSFSSFYSQKIEDAIEKLHALKLSSDRYQEKLIREGSSLTLEDLSRLREQRNKLVEELSSVRSRFGEMLDLAPFAILSEKMAAVKQQIGREMDHSVASKVLLEGKYKQIRDAISSSSLMTGISGEMESSVLGVIKDVLIPKEKEDVKTLLDFTTEQQNRFFLIYDELQNSYSKKFRRLLTDQKRVQTLYANIQRKLHDAESKEKDPIIAEIRKAKLKVDSEIKALEMELEAAKAKKQHIETEAQVLARQISEISHRIQLEDTDKEKDLVTARLIDKLDTFIIQLKQKKKRSLEENLQRELNRLMHKSDFVKKVNVVISGDLIDVELFDHQDLLIDKELLSKGEQQLYATALLKALIDESNIRFPVFIDSPLQKFDKHHSKNIITKFYPNLAGQVVLFPLLQKELNSDEYEWMKHRVGKAYLIKQEGKYASTYREVLPATLFESYNHQQEEYVQ